MDEGLARLAREDIIIIMESVWRGDFEKVWVRLSLRLFVTLIKEHTPPSLMTVEYDSHIRWKGLASYKKMKLYLKKYFSKIFKSNVQILACLCKNACYSLIINSRIIIRTSGKGLGILYRKMKLYFKNIYMYI